MNNTYTKTGASTTSAPSIEEIKKTMEHLNYEQLSILSRFVKGIKVIPDDSGTMCSPNEYVVWMGRKLYDRLKTHIDKENRSILPLDQKDAK